MSYQLISLVFYNLILLFLLFVWIKTKGWQLNGTLYILFFLLFSGIISAFYWNVSNGTIRNYSNLTLIPFFSGHSLKEIADLLGHIGLDTTRIYAKVDIKNLRKVADMDWEGLL